MRLEEFSILEHGFKVRLNGFYGHVLVLATIKIVSMLKEFAFHWLNAFQAMEEFEKIKNVPN